MAKSRGIFILSHFPESQHAFCAWLDGDTIGWNSLKLLPVDKLKFETVAYLAALTEYTHSKSVDDRKNARIRIEEALERICAVFVSSEIDLFRDIPGAKVYVKLALQLVPIEGFTLSQTRMLHLPPYFGPPQRRFVKHREPNRYSIASARISLVIPCFGKGKAAAKKVLDAHHERLFKSLSVKRGIEVVFDRHQRVDHALDVFGSDLSCRVLYYFGHDLGGVDDINGRLNRGNIQVPEVVILNNCNWRMENNNQITSVLLNHGVRYVIASHSKPVPSDAMRFAEDFFENFEGVDSTFDAFHKALSDSRTRYNSNEPDLAWVQYRIFGNIEEFSTPCTEEAANFKPLLAQTKSNFTPDQNTVRASAPDDLRDWGDDNLPIEHLYANRKPTYTAVPSTYNYNVVNRSVNWSEPRAGDLDAYRLSLLLASATAKVRSKSQKAVRRSTHIVSSVKLAKRPISLPRIQRQEYVSNLLARTRPILTRWDEFSRMVTVASRFGLWAYRLAIQTATQLTANVEEKFEYGWKSTGDFLKFIFDVNIPLAIELKEGEQELERRDATELIVMANIMVLRTIGARLMLRSDDLGNEDIDQ